METYLYVLENIDYMPDHICFKCDAAKKSLRESSEEYLNEIQFKYQPTYVDAVDHPSHYTSHPSGVECIEITKHHDFCTGNAIKYLWRCGLKDGNSKLQDLQKAHKYIEFAIEEITKTEASE